MSNIIIAPTPPAPPAPVGGITLSASHADIGDQLTITGSGFGSSRGTNQVWFGEPENEQGWRPVTKEAASYVSWSNTQIVVTVPSMSPGKDGAPGTYHNVRVELDGEDTDPADFYIDPVTTLTTGTGTSTAYAVCANVQNVDGTNYTTTWTPETATFSGDSTMGIWPNANVSDVLFDGVTFTATNGLIQGQQAGVVTIGHRNHNRLTFLNCTFSNNTGAGGGSSGSGVNGVKVAGSSGTAANNDLFFVGCSFGTPNSPTGAFNRISYEQVEDSVAQASRYVAFIDCDFEPASGELISLNGGNIMGLVSGCKFMGLGLNLANSSWLGSGYFEINSGRYVEMRSCEFWNGYGPAFNLNNQPGTDRTILIKDCTIDQTHTYQSPATANCGLSMLDFASYVDVFDTYFNMGTSALHWRYAGYDDWATYTGCDFTGSTITGYYDGGATPAAASSYWTNVGTNNTLPTVVAYSAYPHT